MKIIPDLGLADLGFWGIVSTVVGVVLLASVAAFLLGMWIF